MKGWRVCDDEYSILCRAETRSQAKKFWPEDGYERWGAFFGLRVYREPWLDGDGPAREVMGVYDTCHGPYDEHGECAAGHDCYEGEFINREATLAHLKERER